jgi:hypothetical protein
MMVLFPMIDYECIYSRSSNKNTHYFKLLKDGVKAFTIAINGYSDRYHSVFSLSISYHFHHDMVLYQKYKQLFDVNFEGLGVREDNMVIFEKEELLLDGLRRFLKMI